MTELGATLAAAMIAGSSFFLGWHARMWAIDRPIKQATLRCPWCGARKEHARRALCDACAGIPKAAPGDWPAEDLDA